MTGDGVISVFLDGARVVAGAPVGAADFDTAGAYFAGLLVHDTGGPTIESTKRSTRPR